MVGIPLGGCETYDGSSKASSSSWSWHGHRRCEAAFCAGDGGMNVKIKIGKFPSFGKLQPAGAPHPAPPALSR